MKTTAFLLSLAIAGAAFADDPPMSPSGLVVLHQSASGALALNGTTKVEVPTRAVYVNSSHSQAVSTTGTAILDAPFLYVVGGARFGGTSHCTGQVVRSVAPYADPFSGVHPPSTLSMPDHGSRSISSATTLSPGYYSGGISISGNAAVVLEPGIYVFGGNGFNLSSGSLRGTGVCLIMQSGAMTIAGNSEVNLSPATDGAFPNMVIYQPASNTAQMNLAGGSEVIVSGTVYAPTATLRIVGNSQMLGDDARIGDVVVASRVDLRGTGTIKIGRAGAPAIQLPLMAVYD